MPKADQSVENCITVQFDPKWDIYITDAHAHMEYYRSGSVKSLKARSQDGCKNSVL